MPARSAERIRRQLQTYVDRGVFRGFSEPRRARGKHAYRFTWLTSRAFHLTYEPASRHLVFRSLLPQVPARSDFYRDLKTFVAGRSDEKLPAHRRIDPRRAVVSCVNRGGHVSIAMRLKTGDHYAYGVTKLVNLVHEIFLMLHDRSPEYLWEQFDVSQE